MSRILENDTESGPPVHFGARALFVRGLRFANSAAKFWSSLIDELQADYPECDTLLLETLADSTLSRAMLHPEDELQRELNRGGNTPRNFDQALREALAEFDLYGPSAAVRIRLFAKGAERKKCVLPLDCVDADIFPLLLVWLLEWAETPEGLWNADQVHGNFTASDRKRAWRYRFNFDFTRHHISEGLFQWSLAVQYGREGMEEIPPPRALDSRAGSSALPG